MATLDFLDLPQMLADKYGVHNLELRHRHFMSTEDAYIKDVKDLGVRDFGQFAPGEKSSGGWDRTTDTRLMKPLL